MSESIYILGHSPAEIRRLIDQATILRPTTERLGCGPHPPAADDPGRGRDRGDDFNRQPRKSAQVCRGRNP
jgi:hypothetical protein